MVEPTLRKSSFGAATFAKSSPPVETKVINFTVSFEEALKLSLAVDECVRHLNGYNRSKARGKSAALALIIHLDKKRIRVQEGKLNDAQPVSPPDSDE